MMHGAAPILVSASVSGQYKPIFMVSELVKYLVLEVRISKIWNRCSPSDRKITRSEICWTDEWIGSIIILSSFMAV